MYDNHKYHVLQTVMVNDYKGNTKGIITRISLSDTYGIEYLVKHQIEDMSWYSTVTASSIISAIIPFPEQLEINDRVIYKDQLCTIIHICLTAGNEILYSIKKEKTNRTVSYVNRKSLEIYQDTELSDAKMKLAALALKYKEEELEQIKNSVGNLIAVIDGDGGHKQMGELVEESCLRAEKEVIKYFQNTQKLYEAYEYIEKLLKIISCQNDIDTIKEAREFLSYAENDPRYG